MVNVQEIKSDKNQTIKILTYNLANCVDGSNGIKNQMILKQKKIKLATKRVVENINGQLKQIEGFNPDVVLLQEISKLSFVNCFKNPYKWYKRRLSEYFGDYYASYNILNLVNHGKSTFSKFSSVVVKVKAPFKAKGFLNNYFCGNKGFLINRIKISDHDKELVIFNIHLIAFKKNYAVRLKQMEYVLALASIEVDKGNYVIIGGDWNINLASDGVISQQPKNLIEKTIEWCFAIPEQRTLKSFKQDQGNNGGKIIYDGFLCSTNISVLKVISREDFRFSDHAPVLLEVKLG